MRIVRDNAGTIGVIFVSTALAVMNMGCASSGSPAEGTGSTGRLFDQTEVDSPARLLACGTYQPATSRGVAVRVSFIVTSDGTVEQVAATRSTRGVDSAFQERAREQAIELAEQCLFEPARIGDQPVAVRSGTWFRVDPFPG